MTDEVTPPEDGDTVKMSADNWMEFVPEELREDPSITKYTDFGAFVNGHVNAVKMIGKDKMVVPETDEQFAEVYARLGRPEEPTGYELAVPEGVADEQKFSPEFETTLKTTLHTLGLNGKQAQGVNEFLYATLMASNESAKTVNDEMAAEALTELRKTYGADVDKFVDTSMQIVRQLGGDGADELITKEDLMANPILVKIFAGIADKVLEDVNLPGGQQGVTVADIQTEINELMSHPGYLDGKHVEHKRLVDRVYTLRQKLQAVAA